MKRIRIAQVGWAGYSGQLGDLDFKNGVSIEPVTQRQADRIGALIAVMFLDEEGVDESQAGQQVRMIDELAERSVVQDVLETQTEAEKKAEKVEEPAKPAIPDTVYTLESLQEVADAHGIKGLREISDPYGVKGRAIPELIEEILGAQSKRLAEKTAENVAAVEAERG